MAGYLFVHFIGEKYPEGEQIYFSVSEDGLHWQDLNGGQPVLRSPLGELGVRDPFMVRHPQTKKVLHNCYGFVYVSPAGLEHCSVQRQPGFDRLVIR